MSAGPPPLPPDVPPPVPPDVPPPVPPVTPDPPSFSAAPRPRIVAPADTRGHGGFGFVIALGAQVLQIPIAFLAIPIAQILGQSKNEAQWAILIPLCLFGLTQWLFIVPIALWLRARGKTNTAFGVWITAGVFFGLNAACLGLLFGLAR